MRRCSSTFVILALLAGCQSAHEPPPPSLRQPQVRGPQSPPPRHAPPAGIAPGWAPGATPRAWKYIVIHHSDTASGSAASFDKYHREHNGWKSLGYHFVIGNGNGAANGLVEVGPRWVHQQTGAHAGVRQFNEWGIGICLVGDFQTARPTTEQIQAAARLTAYLMRTYRIPPERVIGHQQANAGRTLCPGRYFPMATLKQIATRLAMLPEPTGALASVELLQAIPE